LNLLQEIQGPLVEKLGGDFIDKAAKNIGGRMCKNQQYMLKAKANNSASNSHCDKVMVRSLK